MTFPKTVFFISLTLFLMLACTFSAPVASPTHQPTETPTLTATITPSNTPTISPSPSPTLPPPTPTPRPSNTPTFTPTPEPTITLQVLISNPEMPTLEPPDWPVVEFEDFSGEADGWRLRDFPSSKASLVNEKFRVWRKVRHYVAAWERPIRFENVTDFYMSVDARQIDGNAIGSYGLQFHQSGDDRYIFVINDAPAFAVFRYINHHTTPLIMWTYFDGISTTEENQLAIIAQKNHFEFYINGQLVAEVNDGTLPKGKVALALIFHNNGDEATFEFDNFELRAP
ncbi:MAG: hypothetical protein GY805_38330 [Chloroflexi bacterium]|nr:hypothetical protein [Chloroflexota bacterium]